MIDETPQPMSEAATLYARLMASHRDVIRAHDTFSNDAVVLAAMRPRVAYTDQSIPSNGKTTGRITGYDSKWMRFIVTHDGDRVQDLVRPTDLEIIE